MHNLAHIESLKENDKVGGQLVAFTRSFSQCMVF